MDCYLTCIDHELNRFRFYSMSVQYGLFGGFSLIRQWGRIGTKGRSLTQKFDTMEEVEDQVDKILKVRKRHGYTLHTKTDFLSANLLIHLKSIKTGETDEEKGHHNGFKHPVKESVLQE